MSWVVIVAILVPFAVSFLGTYVIRRMALARGFVDRAGGHKQHGRPVALGGGVAIFLAICAPLLIGAAAAWLLRDGAPPGWLPSLVATHLDGVASKLPVLAAIVGCTLVLHAVGLLDDRRAMGPAPKFAVQLLVAVVTAWPLGIRAVEAIAPPLSIAVTVLWILLITNAFNFLDNMDGLSAGVGAIAAAIFAVAAMSAGQVFVPVMAWVMVGALVGFLLFNFSPASIFMGDAGSLVIGYLLAVLTILTTYYDPSKGLTPMGVAVPIVVLAVPLYDVGSVIVRRLRAGVSPFKGDWRHFSHRLVKKGMSPRGAVLTIYLATAATGLPAIVLPHVEWMGAVLLLVQCACVVLMIAILEGTGTAPSAGARDSDAP